MKTFIIQDWTGKRMQLKGQEEVFDSFESAEDHLSEFLGDRYETERGEYYIVQE